MDECHLQTVYRVGTIKLPVFEAFNNDEATYTCTCTCTGHKVKVYHNTLYDLNKKGGKLLIALKVIQEATCVVFSFL